MKSQIREVSPTQKELTIEIDAAVLRESYGKVSKRYADRANVPGFRKGYAPLDVIRLRFKDEIKGDVLQDVIPGQIEQAIIHYTYSVNAQLNELTAALQRKEKIGGTTLLWIYIDPTGAVGNVKVKKTIPATYPSNKFRSQRRLAFTPENQTATINGVSAIQQSQL